MPTYTFVKQNGQQIERLYNIGNVPNQIVCQDGSIAKKIFKPCYFNYSIDVNDQLDKKKRQQDHKNYMNQFGVSEFVPLKGQNQDQIQKDFQNVKYQMQQQLQQKKINRRKKQKQDRKKKKKSFNDMIMGYEKDCQKRKQFNFNKQKISF